MEVVYGAVSVAYLVFGAGLYGFAYVFFACYYGIVEFIAAGEVGGYGRR